MLNIVEYWSDILMKTEKIWTYSWAKYDTFYMHIFSKFLKIIDKYLLEYELKYK